MRLRLLAILLFANALAATAQAMPPIELELATERGLQITAPHQWLQLLTGLGIDNVRIRAATAGDRPHVTNRGSDTRPRYHVVGILTSREELRLPGATFRAGDRVKLREYFERLGKEGADALTAPRGRFGLTEKQLIALQADLTQSIDFTTRGLWPQAVVDRLQSRLAHRVLPDAAANRVLRGAEPVPDDLRGLSVGTGLAIMLRSYGLLLRPDQPLGEPVVLRMTAIDPAADAPADHWPVGWEPELPTGRLAPVLMEMLNVEIDGYTLTEAIEAIAPRIKIPIYWDHARLAERKIDPTSINVRLPRTRTFYKRILDRTLAQARLAALLRVDEAGTVFLWITQ